MLIQVNLNRMRFKFISEITQQMIELDVVILEALFEVRSLVITILKNYEI